MTESDFESALSIICERLKLLAFDKPFRSASDFEIRVREVGTPEKGIRRLDPDTANERRVVGPNAWLYSGQ